jgi:hypothetical protein
MKFLPVKNFWDTTMTDPKLSGDYTRPDTWGQTNQGFYNCTSKDFIIVITFSNSFFGNASDVSFILLALQIVLWTKFFDTFEFWSNFFYIFEFWSNLFFTQLSFCIFPYELTLYGN